VQILKRLLKRSLMRRPLLWLKLRTAIRKLTGRNEAELDLLRLLVPPGRLALDVGANNGVYTQELLKLTDRVIAFEPTPRYIDELRLFFENRIRLVEAALSDRTGTAELIIPVSSKSDLTALATIETENPLARQARCHRLNVPMLRLDDLELRDVGFMKIDVEGHEEAVIAGAEETLTRSRPTLLIEAEDRHRPQAIAKLAGRLERLGYQGYFLERGAMTPLSRFEITTHQPLSAVPDLWRGGPRLYCNNFIFLPIDRAEAPAAPLTLQANAPDDPPRAKFLAR
jgi:FkbM family methyltransferase